LAIEEWLARQDFSDLGRAVAGRSTLQHVDDSYGFTPNTRLTEYPVEQLSTAAYKWMTKPVFISTRCLAHDEQRNMRAL
jgi:hypothetical protein